METTLYLVQSLPMAVAVVAPKLILLLNSMAKLVEAAVAALVVALGFLLEVEALEALLQQDKVLMVLVVAKMVMAAVEVAAVPAVQMERQVKMLAQPAAVAALVATEPLAV
jgi:hypothetical protein